MKPASPATPSPLTRHTFLQQSAVDAGGLARPPIIPASARAAAGAVPPSARTPIGLIGKGVRANGHLKFLAHRDAVELVAVCAVDRLRRKAGCAEIAEINAGKKSVGSCQSCTADHDYREFLARPAIDAAQVGQDIDGDQPVAMTIQVGRRIAETVRRSGRVFPTGTPDRSIPDVPRVGQFVGDGCLGQVKSVSPLQNHPSLHRRSMLQIRRWRRGGRPRRNQHFCRPPRRSLLSRPTPRRVCHPPSPTPTSSGPRASSPPLSPPPRRRSSNFSPPLPSRNTFAQPPRAH